ncbi:putative CCR4-associated factor 1 11 [Zea mays]|jgi:CCR4-NOT transcription complex subunit 7/8|uniref:poly(A)-specific ribonuclease n=1 Tax=Zea mays TaxID=4577 RepID=A0A317Y8Q4_MAIZE|nr:putative CCR4-associated factor 1 11 [Zea mays]
MTPLQPAPMHTVATMPPQSAPMPTMPMIPPQFFTPMPTVPMTALQPAPMLPMMPPQFFTTMPTVPITPLQPAQLSTPMPIVPTTPLQPAPMYTVTTMPSQSAPMPTVPMMPPQFFTPMPTVPVMPPQPAPFPVPVHEVWADNFHEVEAAVGYFAAHARFVAVGLHYPGVVHGADHRGLVASTAEQRYATVKANVDALKPLQLGLAVITEAREIAAWEFNLSDFDPTVDPHAVRSIAYLRRRGLRCDELRLRGIPVAKLTRVLRLICRPGVSWVTHTGAYHVAYLMKVINGGNKLPGDMAGFLAAVRLSLGEDVYDVATMASDCQDMPAGLEGIASRLGVAPPLSMHPLAGAGSVLALQAFMELRFHVFRGNVTRYRGVLQGLQVT